MLFDVFRALDIPRDVYGNRGRRPVDLWAILLMLCFKEANRMSLDDIVDFFEPYRHLLGVKRVPCRGTLGNYWNTPEVREYMRLTVMGLASFVKGKEVMFGLDATGFATDEYARWFSEQEGYTKARKRFMKGSIMAELNTMLITAVEVTPGAHNETNDLPELVKNTWNYLDIWGKPIVADKGYLSRKNVKAIARWWAIPYIPPKKGTIATPRGVRQFREMVEKYVDHPGEFLRTYHQRSKVESIFGAVKRQYGSRLRAKRKVAREVEVLCRFVCWNVSRVLELGLWKG